MILSNLMQPGDLLTYGPSGIFGWIIRIKTWHPIAHVETYIGNGMSVASRDEIGVGQYPLRLEQLNGIYRPKEAFNLQKGLDWFKTVNGQKYDWFGLLCFTDLIDRGSKNKMFCSEFCTNLYREMGIEPISIHERPEEVAPFELAESPSFTRIWAAPEILKRDNS